MKNNKSIDDIFNFNDGTNNLILCSIQKKLNYQVQKYRKKYGKAIRIKGKKDYEDLREIVESSDKKLAVYIVYINDVYGDKLSKLRFLVEENLIDFDSVIGIYSGVGFDASKTLRISIKNKGEFKLPEKIFKFKY